MTKVHLFLIGFHYIIKIKFHLQFSSNLPCPFLFKVELQQNYKVSDWRGHKRVQQFHVDVEKSTSKVEGFIVCNRFYVDDFNLHGNQGEKNENEHMRKSSGGFTQKSSEMMESAGCSTRAPQLTIKKYYTEKVFPSFVHLPLLAFSFLWWNEWKNDDSLNKRQKRDFSQSTRAGRGASGEKI